MCIRCHPSREQRVLQMLQKVRDAPEFANWNMTSFHHMLLMIKGHNGEEVHHRAVHVAKQFCTWFVTQTHPRFGFPEHAVLQREIDEAIAFFEAHRCLCTEEHREISVTE